MILALKWSIVLLSVLCSGASFALLTIYVRRSYAQHVVPMAISMLVVLGVLAHRAVDGTMPNWELWLVASALLVKCVGLWTIVKRVQARPRMETNP